MGTTLYNEWVFSFLELKMEVYFIVCNIGNEDFEGNLQPEKYSKINRGMYFETTFFLSVAYYFNQRNFREQNLDYCLDKLLQIEKFVKSCVVKTFAKVSLIIGIISLCHWVFIEYRIIWLSCQYTFFRFRKFKKKFYLFLFHFCRVENRSRS